MWSQKELIEKPQAKNVTSQLSFVVASKIWMSLLTVFW
jgi:hypothetical protein